MLKKKRGVKTQGLKQPMVKVLQLYNDLCALAGHDGVITDAVASRSNKSLHPVGLAVDLRTSHLGYQQKSIMFSLLVRLLGNDYDCINYDTHIHVEYQRQLDDNKVANMNAVFLVKDFDEVN